MIQKKNLPLSLAEEVALLWAATKGFLDEIAINDINEFETKFLDDLRLTNSKLLDTINKNKLLSEKDEKELEIAVKKTLSV